METHGTANGSVSLHGDGPSVRLERQGGVSRIRLDAPPVNALSHRLVRSLRDTLEAAAADSGCRVVVLAAAGKTFSAGHDLSELLRHQGDADGGRAFFEALFADLAGLAACIAEMDMPVVAEVAGLASGAGCMLVAACDLAIATEDATFRLPGVRLGVPDALPAAVLAAVGLASRPVAELLLTGEAVDARAAREFGLVNRVVPPEYLGTVVGRYAGAIEAASAIAARAAKKALRTRPLLAPNTRTLAIVDTVEALLQPDAGKGIRAVLEKRSPQWPSR